MGSKSPRTCRTAGISVGLAQAHSTLTVPIYNRQWSLGPSVKSPLQHISNTLDPAHLGRNPPATVHGRRASPRTGRRSNPIGRNRRGRLFIRIGHRVSGFSDSQGTFSFGHGCGHFDLVDLVRPVQLASPGYCRHRFDGLFPDVISHRESRFVIIASLLIGWAIGLTNVAFGIMTVGRAGLSLSILAVATPKRVRHLV